MCRTSAPSTISASAPTAPAKPASAQGTSATTAETPAAEQPESGGTLRWGLLGNIVTLDGHNYGGTTHVFHLFDRLIVLDEQLNWVPRLAESWDISADYTRFTLYTVVISTQQSYPYISHILESLNMLDPVTMQQPDGVNNTVGTGPFKFVEYAQGDHLTLAKNPNYWRSGLPYVDTLHMPIFADPQTQVTALEGGSLDAAVNVGLRDAARLQKISGYQLILNNNSGALYVIRANTTWNPTNNRLLRQAIQYGIDRQRIADSVLLGLGQATQLPDLAKIGVTLTLKPTTGTLRWQPPCRPKQTRRGQSRRPPRTVTMCSTSRSQLVLRHSYRASQPRRVSGASSTTWPTFSTPQKHGAPDTSEDNHGIRSLCR